MLEFCAFLYASGVSTVSYIALDDEFDVIYSGQSVSTELMFPFDRHCMMFEWYHNDEYMITG